jgi:hypothetical protein
MLESEKDDGSKSTIDLKLEEFKQELKAETTALVKSAVTSAFKDLNVTFGGQLGDNRPTTTGASWSDGHDRSGASSFDVGAEEYFRTHSLSSRGQSVPSRRPGARGPGTSPLQRPSAPATSDPAESAGVDHQAEFAVIKDSLSRFKLPVDLKFAPNVVGIKREDKTAYNVVKNAASYVECNLKILSLLEAHNYDLTNAVNDLAIINTALLKYLKEEHATLLVQGKFSKDTASMFKALRKEGNSFTQDSLETLQLAANLTQYNINNQNSGGDRGRGDGYRGRYRGRGYRGYQNYRGQGYNQRDTFSRIVNQDVPERRPQSDDN